VDLGKPVSAQKEEEGEGRQVKANLHGGYILCGLNARKVCVVDKDADCDREADETAEYEGHPEHKPTKGKK